MRPRGDDPGRPRCWPTAACATFASSAARLSSAPLQRALGDRRSWSSVCGSSPRARMWASLALAAMGAGGSSSRRSTPGHRRRQRDARRDGIEHDFPSAVAVALFAFLGTRVVAKHGFGHEREDVTRSAQSSREILPFSTATRDRPALGSTGEPRGTRARSCRPRPPGSPGSGRRGRRRGPPLAVMRPGDAHERREDAGGHLLVALAVLPALARRRASGGTPSGKRASTSTRLRPGPAPDVDLAQVRQPGRPRAQRAPATAVAVSSARRSGLE